MNCDFIMIPRILFNDSSLSETDRMVMGLIISLTLKNTYCYASNEYLEKYINKSQRTINYSLSKLKKLEYIKVKFENGKRRIYLNTDKIPTKNALESAKTSNEKHASINIKINIITIKKMYLIGWNIQKFVNLVLQVQKK